MEALCQRRKLLQTLRTIKESRSARDHQIKPGESARIYLIDPLANLMMSFPESVPPKAVRKDLVRLLKAAWAG